jgi:hypothetical protein
MIDQLLILAFEIVGCVFLLGMLVAQIMREEIDKAARQRVDEEAFFYASLGSHFDGKGDRPADNINQSKEGRK